MKAVTEFEVIAALVGKMWRTAFWYKYIKSWKNVLPPAQPEERGRMFIRNVVKLA